MLSPALIWFLVGVVFLISELFIPGFILVFFAAGSWITAVFVWFFDASLTFQIILFIIASLLLLFTLRKIGLRTFRGEALEETDDLPSDAKIGKTAEVTQKISPHTPGEIKVMGSFWRAVADTEIEAGVSVIVEGPVNEDGLTFRVKQF